MSFRREAPIRSKRTLSASNWMSAKDQSVRTLPAHDDEHRSPGAEALFRDLLSDVSRSEARIRNALWLTGSFEIF